MGNNALENSKTCVAVMINFCLFILCNVKLIVVHNKIVVTGVDTKKKVQFSICSNSRLLLRSHLGQGMLGSKQLICETLPQVLHRHVSSTSNG